MVNIFTAKAIAEKCDTAMEGSEFGNLSEAEMNEVIPGLKVLVRPSSENKRTLVIRLKEMGGKVAATGDGTNDALTLKAADIGFSMGISGTEVGKRLPLSS